MFATKFGSEEEFTFPIKGPFYLCNEVVQDQCGDMPCIIIIVQLDDEY